MPSPPKQSPSPTPTPTPSTSTLSISPIKNTHPLTSTSTLIITHQYILLKLHILIRQIKALIIRVKATQDNDQTTVIPFMDFILNLSGVYITQGKDAKIGELMTEIWELRNVQPQGIAKTMMDVKLGLELQVQGAISRVKSTGGSDVDYVQILSSLTKYYEIMLSHHTNALKAVKLERLGLGEPELNFEQVKGLIESPVEAQSMIKFVTPVDRVAQNHLMAKIPLALDLLSKQMINSHSLGLFVMQLRELQTKMMETYLKKINYWSFLFLRGFSVLLKLQEVQCCVWKFYADCSVSYYTTWKRLKEGNEQFRLHCVGIEKDKDKDESRFIMKYFHKDLKMVFTMQSVSDFSKEVIMRFDQTTVLIERMGKIIKLWKDDVERQGKLRISASLKNETGQLSRSGSVLSCKQQQQHKTLVKLNFASSPSHSNSDSSSEHSSPITSPLRRTASLIKKQPASSSPSPSPHNSSQSTITRQRSASNSSITSPVRASSTTVQTRARSGSNSSTTSQSSLLNSQRTDSPSSSRSPPSSQLSRTSSVRTKHQRPQSVIVNQAFDIRTQLRRQQQQQQVPHHNQNHNNQVSNSGNLPTQKPVQNTPKPNFKALQGPGVNRTRTRSTSLQSQLQQQRGQIQSQASAAASASAIFRSSQQQQHILNTGGDGGVNGKRANSLQSIMELSAIRERLNCQERVTLDYNDSLRRLVSEDQEEEEGNKIGEGGLLKDDLDHDDDFEKSVIESLKGAVLKKEQQQADQQKEEEENENTEKDPVQNEVIITPISSPIKTTAVSTITDDQQQESDIEQTVVPTTAATEPSLTSDTTASTPEEDERDGSPSPSTPLKQQQPRHIQQLQPIIKKVRFIGVPQYTPQEDQPSPSSKLRSPFSALRFRSPLLNSHASPSNGRDAELMRQERLTFVKLRNKELEEGEELVFKGFNGSGNGNKARGFGGKWKLFR